MRRGDLGQHPPARAIGARKAAVAERAVIDDRHTVLLAPRDHPVLDAALGEMVEHLVAGDMAVAGDLPHLFEVAGGEIADPPAEDLALVLQFLERGDGLLERVRPAPMQQVAIEPVGAQAGERALARGPHARPRSILRRHLGDQKDFVAAPGDRLADQLFGGAVTVDFGGVDMVHAEIEPVPQCRDRGRAMGLVEIPGADADHRHLASGRAEYSPLHRFLHAAEPATRLPSHTASRSTQSAPAMP